MTERSESRLTEYQSLYEKTMKRLNEKFDDEKEYELYILAKYEVAIDNVHRIHPTLVSMKIKLLQTIFDHIDDCY